jgi:hypothetical protein
LFRLLNFIVISRKLTPLTYLKEIQEYYIINGGISPLGRKYLHWPEKYSDTEFNRGVKNLEKEGIVESFDISDFNDRVNSVKDEFTIYENPTSISLLSSIKNKLREFFAHMQNFGFFDPIKFYFPENVALGTTQFGYINAMAIAAPDEVRSKIILFDSGIFIFMNSLSKIVSTILPKKIHTDFIEYTILKHDIDTSINKNEEFSDLFVNLITTYLLQGNAKFSAKFSASQYNYKLAEVLRDTAELFIIAHEYGHILLNHLTLSRIEKIKLAESLKVDVWQIDWRHEFQADEFASIAVMRINHVLKDMEAPIAFAGVPFFFSAIDILYKCMNVEFSETHPSPINRLEALYSRLYLDTNDIELVNEIKEFGNAINYIIISLWTQNKDKIMKIITEYNST